MSGSGGESPQVAAALAELKILLGAQIIGATIGWTAIGISTVQLYLYFQRFQDHILTQATIVTLFFAQIATMCVGASASWTDIVGSRGDPSRLAANDTTTLFNASIILLVFQSALVQGFFIYRIWSLSHNFILAGISALCAAAQISIGAAFVIIWIIDGFAQLVGRPKTMITLWLISQVVTDSVLAITMSIALLSKRSNIKSTNTLLQRLVLYAVSSGGITGLVSILSLIGLKTNTLFLFIFTGALYTSTYTVVLLANLHSRTTLRKIRQGGAAVIGEKSSGIAMRSIQTGINSNAQTQSSTTAAPIASSRVQTSNVTSPKPILVPAFNTRPQSSSRRGD